MKFPMNARQLLFIPPLAIGIGVFLWMNNANKDQTATSIPEQAQAVRVVEIAKRSFIPEISGFGRLEAVQSWSAIAQVEGRASYLDPATAVGKLVPEDSKLIGIDSRNYEIALDRAKANRDSAQAALDELDTTQSNNRATLKLEQEVKSLLQSDLDRQIELKSRGSASQTTVDTARRSLLAQQKVILGIENTLRLVPAQKASLEASIAARDVEIEEAQRSLDNTVITAPFTGLVTEKDIAKDQYMRVGDKMLTLEDISASEVVAEFQPYVLGQLFRSIARLDLQELLVMGEEIDVFDRISELDLKASIRLPDDEGLVIWPAKLVRFNGTADGTTGALGMAVRIETPYKPDPINRRPPLSNGTFVKVTLSARNPLEAIRIPRSAVHTSSDGKTFVYVMDSDSRLATKEIVVGPALDSMIVIREGLNVGDSVVISEPIPAVIGSLLDPVKS
ncbi:efflux RND transporter periplasmic adaptor subunit [Cohaesibacter celericrescens]|uniref:Multidrug resistance protein MdtA-like C-terminal permuted SH3 domain-containing protein n=1 Tax=Cohaesibacter celericrescens TaxID=2067669 RepID=A0A2N5XX77_9HYPH|nr:hypothetical protein [Cohaesibacter celericrescens]PLW79045.1 hypothetical protein C0081_02085 [Cohaesibacter celericrescens]